MSSAFGTLQDGHTLGVGGGTTMRPETMGTWKMRWGDSGQCHELRKGFCLCKTRLGFQWVL